MWRYNNGVADNPRLEELRRRVQSDPASIAFAALAEEYRRAGRFDDAVATCAVGLKRHPSYLSAHVTLGRALIELGQYDDAQEELEFVLRAAPENLSAIRGLAEIHHRRGDAVYSAYAADEDPLGGTPLASGRQTMPASVVVAPAVARPSGLPPVDPAVAALESFLHAIRQARATGAVSPR